MVISADILDLARQLAVLHRHRDLIAGRQRRRVTNDLRAIAIPAHRVAARQYRQRAEALESRDGRTKPRVERVTAPIADSSQMAVAGDQPGPQASETATQIERLEREAQRLILPF